MNESELSSKYDAVVLLLEAKLKCRTISEIVYTCVLGTLNLFYNKALRTEKAEAENTELKAKVKELQDKCDFANEQASSFMKMQGEYHLKAITSRREAKELHDYIQWCSKKVNLPSLEKFRELDDEH
jgi:hypothetical protein